jgi:hypothetical protein
LSTLGDRAVALWSSGRAQRSPPEKEASMDDDLRDEADIFEEELAAEMGARGIVAH